MPPKSIAHSGADADAARLSAHFVRDAHQLCRDLHAVRLRRYWLDFGLTALVAWAGLLVLLTADPPGVQAGAFVVCGLAIYRAVVFIHEIVHRPRGTFRAFAIAWNVCCGVPFLMPTFMYGDHKGHHSSDAYGTWSDPEYLLRGRYWALRLTAFLMLPVVYPLLLAVRFLVLTPLAIASPRLNRLVWTYGSSLYVMNERYRREHDAQARAASRWIQEFACAGWAWTVAGFAFAGFLPAIALGKVYAVFVFWIALNQLRTLAAHRYAGTDGRGFTYLDQVLDTNTFDRGLVLPNLWAPVGLRYHALHHLMPALPYHAMGAAHRRLLAALPPASPYHRTLKPGLWPVLVSIRRRQTEGLPACRR